MEEIQDSGSEFLVTQEAPSSWLKRLADESWQAELVISGAAIFGSLSLPDLIHKVGNWCLMTFAADKFFLLGMIMMYLQMMAGGLIVAFLAHFFIRVLWIGMLGLNSVYPQGIRPIASYSDDFNEKLKNEFPDLEKFNHKLDQMGSLVFSLASSGVMVGISSIFVLVVMMLIASLLHAVIPAISFNLIVIGLVVLLMIPTLLNMFLHAKGLRDKPWAKKWHFPIFSISTKVIYTIFYKPFSYIIYTLISNAQKQGNMGLTLIFGLVIALFGGITASQSNVKYFLNEESYIRHGRPVYGLKATFYEDQRESDELVLYASLESDVLSGKFVKVFVPIYGREDEAREHFCGEYVETDSSKNVRIEKQAFENACLEKYLSVFLNEKEISDYSLIKYDHPETGQFGVNVYVPCSECKVGANEIKVSRPYPVGAEKPFDVFLPFMYEGEYKRE